MAQRAWSAWLPILTGKHGARKQGWRQNPVGFLSSPRKRQVNRKRPSHDGRPSGFGIPESCWVAGAGRETGGQGLEDSVSQGAPWARPFYVILPEEAFVKAGPRNTDPTKIL